MRANALTCVALSLKPLRTYTPFLTYFSPGAYGEQRFRATLKAFLVHPCFSLSALRTSQWKPYHSLAYPELLRQCLPRPRFEPREPGPQVQAVCPLHMLWKLCHAPWFVAMSVFPCYHSLLDYKLLGQRFALFPLVLKLPCLLNTILEAKMRQWVGGQDRDIRAWLPPPTGPCCWL